jgi:hypothetical protein
MLVDGTRFFFFSLANYCQYFIEKDAMCHIIKGIERNKMRITYSWTLLGSQIKSTLEPFFISMGLVGFYIYKICSPNSILAFHFFQGDIPCTNFFYRIYTQFF